jgi:hypothetical protein
MWWCDFIERLTCNMCATNTISQRTGRPAELAESRDYGAKRICKRSRGRHNPGS